MNYFYQYLGLLLVFYHVTFVTSSHFRGGTVSWKHTATDGNLHQVEVNFRLSWRKSSSTPQCDESWIGNKNIGGYGNGNWLVKLSNNPYTSQYSTAIFCTTYDIPGDWMSGYNSFAFNMTKGSSANVTFQSNGWIGSLIFGAHSSWSLALSNIDTSMRSDTGKANHPPSTLSAPVIKLQQGCAQDIVIPTLDEDGDKVTCRYAHSSLECGGICGSYAHFTLNQATCSLRYDGGGGQYLIPVALMLEDHPREDISIGGKDFNISDTLSSIPLQFLVQVTQSTSASQSSCSAQNVSDCNVQPTYPRYGLQDGAVVLLAVNEQFNETLYAYPSTPCDSIDHFIVIGPVGLHQSTMVRLSGNLWTMQIWWSPGPKEYGEHTLCFYAVDSLGKSSQQYCIKIIVAVSENTCLEKNGGCSDTCISTGKSNTCSCSLSCWELAEDSKTCIPDMDLKCDGESMEVCIRKCATTQPFVVAESDDFADLSCRSAEKGPYHYLTFTASQCGATYQISAAGVRYVASVWTWKGTYYGEAGNSDVVTRGEWIKIPVSCNLATTAYITGSFVPILPVNEEFLPEEAEIDGMGSFSLAMKVYNTSLFTDVYDSSKYPIRTTVDDKLYFSLIAIGRTGLELFTKDCVASSTQVLTANSLFYYIIQNGCVLDPTVIIYNSSSPMELRYSIDAFQFAAKLIAKEEDSEVYLTCNVILCDVTDSDSRCRKGCLPGSSRSRRSQGGSLGPVIVNNDEKLQAPGEDASDDFPPHLKIKQLSSQASQVSARIILAGRSGENPGDG